MRTIITVTSAALLFLSIPNIGLATLDIGLEAYYPFDGNADDASGHGLDGVSYNTSPAMDRFGNPSAAMSFNGTSESYVDLGAPASLRFMSDFTITAWIKFTGGMVNARIVSYGDDNGYELLTFGSSDSCVSNSDGCVQFHGRCKRRIAWRGGLGYTPGKSLEPLVR